mgnify:CR=1 FL=1
MEEKRKDRRLDLESRILAKRVGLEDQLKDEIEEEAEIDVKNISKRGIGFTCDQVLKIGSVYECLLTIWTKETIHAFVQVVRSVKQDDTCFYGGIFIGMTEVDMKRIEIYERLLERSEMGG